MLASRHLRPGGELLFQPVYGRLPVAVVNPIEKPERPQVPATQCVFFVEAGFPDRLHGQPGYVQLDDAVIAQAAVVDGVGLDAGLMQGALGEGGRVEDDQSALPEVGELDLEGGRVHGDQGVELIARGLDFPGAEIDLERGHPEGGAGRRPHFGGEIGEGRQVLSGQGRGLGELAADQLHAVAGISGEQDHDRFKLLAGKACSARLERRYC